MHGIVCRMSLSLQEIISLHGQWLASGGQEGRRANFRGADLTGQVIVGVNLSQASFRNAVLNNVHFSECQLSEADFAEVTGNSAQFQACEMKQINFARAHLVNLQIEQSVMERASFLQARLDSALFRDVRLAEANFREAMLPNWVSERVELRKATLRSLQAQYAVFTQVRMDGVDGKEANFSHGKFSQVAWHGAYLRGTLFQNVLLEDSDLTTAEEVEALAVSATEKTHAAQREEEIQALERQRNLILELQHALTKREETLNSHQQELELFRQQVAREEAGMKQRASSLRMIAAGWTAIAAMTIVFFFDRFQRYATDAELIELLLMGLAVLLLLIIHIASASITYGASRQLWRVVEENEALELHDKHE